jgi:hypothetical protein
VDQHASERLVRIPDGPDLLGINVALLAPLDA